MSLIHRLLVVMLLVCCASTTIAQMYSADMKQAEWKTASSPFACSLSHTIPKFGKALFSRKTGVGETFVLESDGAASFPAGPAGLMTFPPVWRNDLLPVKLGAVLAVEGNQPIAVPAAQLAPAIAQLTSGVRVMFTSQPVDNPGSAAGFTVVRVVLEPKNFSSAYKTYKQCMADIIPYGFAQVARTFINYGENPEGLSASNKADLFRVARYVKADDKVLGVFVDGHSDNSGTPEENEIVSKHEAEWVAAYLTEQGIPAAKITTRWHGDKFPIGNNKTPAGRAQNRRVTVRLEDEAARKETEKKIAEEKLIAEKNEAKQKLEADKKAAEENTKNNTATHKKMTPEEINRMVEGLDLINGK